MRASSSFWARTSRRPARSRAPSASRAIMPAKAQTGVTPPDEHGRTAARVRGFAMSLLIRRADFDDPRDCDDVVGMLDAYASDPKGGGRPLPGDVRARLAPALRANPTALVWLAFADAGVVGIAVCFEGFSTFAA